MTWRSFDVEQSAISPVHDALRRLLGMSKRTAMKLKAFFDGGAPDGLAGGQSTGDSGARCQIELHSGTSLDAS